MATILNQADAIRLLQSGVADREPGSRPFLVIDVPVTSDDRTRYDHTDGLAPSQTTSFMLMQDKGFPEALFNSGNEILFSMKDSPSSITLKLELNAVEKSAGMSIETAQRRNHLAGVTLGGKA